MTRVAAIAVALVATACGQPTGLEREVQRPQALRALDEPAPAELTRELRALEHALAGPPDDPESQAKERVLLGIVPARDSEPRAVAELPLSGPWTLRMYAWRSHRDKLCLWAAVAKTRDQLDGGPVGPCIAVPPCARLCVEQERVETIGDRTIVVGAIDARADTIRFRSEPGAASAMTFATDGPRIRGFPGWRVFALDLGRRSYGIAELYDGPRLVETRESYGYDYETEECLERAAGDEEAERDCL